MQEITFNSPTEVICSWIESEAKIKFGDASSKFAAKCAKAGHEYLKSLPVGANIDITTKKAQRKIKRDLTNHIKVVAFDPITDFFILALIGGIIGWVVQQILDLYFPHPFGH